MRIYRMSLTRQPPLLCGKEIRSLPPGHLYRQHGRHCNPTGIHPITCFAFHPIFSFLASESEDYTVRIWYWELGELERIVKGRNKAVLGIDFWGSRGGTLLASCSSGLTIKLWDSSDEHTNIFFTLPGHDHSGSEVQFVLSGAAGSPPSGNLLISASRDKFWRIWDISTDYCLRTVRGHADWVRDITLLYGR